MNIRINIAALVVLLLALFLEVKIYSHYVDGVQMVSIPGEE